MPTYAWSCPKCESEFTRVLSLSEYNSLPDVICVGTAEEPHEEVAVKRIYEVSVILPEGFHG